MKQINIKETDAGQRFDKFLFRLMPGAGKSFLYKMLRKKNITLNGKRAEGNEIVSEGDVVEVFFSDETFEKFCSTTGVDKEKEQESNAVLHRWNLENPKPSVVYDGEHILILN
ncbi:MAG: RluA family pseudouridine synthase, partial [Lachnospiraceae bacterium]|nr:RluA family pseudouridine synthase [Lachnospiraceae bacterium]